MPSNPLLHFITKSIKFEGFKATNYHFITENEQNELFIELENKENLSTCPHCHKTTDKVHQSHRYRVRDIPFSSKEKRKVERNRKREIERCQKSGT